MTLKQSQAHQTYNENVHSEQGYKHANFQRSLDNIAQENDIRGFFFFFFFFFFKRIYVSYLPLTYAKSIFWYIHDLHHRISNRFNLIG